MAVTLGSDRNANAVDGSAGAGATPLFVPGRTAALVNMAKQPHVYNGLHVTLKRSRVVMIRDPRSNKET